MNRSQNREGLVIGVTGHRFVAEVEKVSAGIDQALESIEKAFPDKAWAALSSLGEGADQMVVERILSRRSEHRLLAVLPQSPSSYQAAFVSQAARKRFKQLLRQADHVTRMPPTPTPEQDFLAMGLYILSQCYVLVAVWDGKQAQGMGGTGDIVAQARQRGLPVAWVHCGNRQPGTTIATTLGSEQGKVTLERFPTLNAE